MRIIFSFDFKKFIKPRQNELQGFIYSLIKKTKFKFLHNLPQKESRLFSFSQIFSQKKRQDYSLIFASPISELVKSLYNLNFRNTKIGENDGQLKGKRIINFHLNYPLSLKTETPIILRIPKEKYSLYGLKLVKLYPYFYWRPHRENISFEPFIQQLEAGVYKKYKLFTGREITEQPIFSKFLYKKTLDLPYFKDGEKIFRIGTLWEFGVNPSIDLNLVRFIMDTGLGELNSQGYGFMSVKR